MAILLFIILCCLNIHHSISNQINLTVHREVSGDRLWPNICSNSTCPRYSTEDCHDTEESCCGSCMCKNKTTLINLDGKLKCVLDVARQEGCYYNFWGLHSRQLVKSVSINENLNLIGRIIYTNKYEGRLENCTINEDKSTYWDMFRWLPLFGGKRKSADFFAYPTGSNVQIQIESKDSDIKILRRKYEGLLIKLIIQCGNKSITFEESCIVFKVLGKSTYAFDNAPPTTTTAITFTDQTKKASLKESGKSDIAIFASLIPVCVILLAICIFLGYFWRRKRRNANQAILINASQHSKNPLLQAKSSEKDLEMHPSSSFANPNDPLPLSPPPIPERLPSKQERSSRLSQNGTRSSKSSSSHYVQPIDDENYTALRQFETNYAHYEYPSNPGLYSQPIDPTENSKPKPEYAKVNKKNRSDNETLNAQETTADNQPVDNDISNDSQENTNTAVHYDKPKKENLYSAMEDIKN